ncbi:hypothetical protein [Synechococcus sp. 1G10]|uniref:hypothetical protein n=1 Tax=Synechococcus sp. 1G10 TaxID=2025605 RepID=UPI00117E986D|nr:hypothetical protein [Synechococcus sp. 1G10]
MASTTPAWANPTTPTKQLEGTATPGSEKQSPYAAAKEAPTPVEPMEGTQAPGSEKESPYAAPKESIASAPMVDTGKLWGLLVPIVLATGSYLVLRSREGNEDA